MATKVLKGKVLARFFPGKQLFPQVSDSPGYRLLPNSFEVAELSIFYTGKKIIQRSHKDRKSIFVVGCVVVAVEFGLATITKLNLK
jgi:hypothetical protein